MADKVAMMIARDKAMLRLVKAAEIVSGAMSSLGVKDLVVIPKQRDPEYQSMVQMEALANWTESIAAALQDASLTIERGDDGATTETAKSKSKR